MRDRRAWTPIDRSPPARRGASRGRCASIAGSVLPWLGALLVAGGCPSSPNLGGHAGADESSTEHGTTMSSSGTDAPSSGSQTETADGSSTGSGAEASETEGPGPGETTGDDAAPPTVVAAEDRFEGPQGVALVVIATEGVLSNDVHRDGAMLTARSSATRTREGGTIELEPSGAFRYEPPADWWGEDGFDYVASATDGSSATGHVRLVVSPVQVGLERVAQDVGGFAVDSISTGGVFDNGIGLGGTDIDGDGLADIVLGYPDADDDEGRVFVLLGRPDPSSIDLLDFGEDDGFRVLPDADSDAVGVFVNAVGDVNGDGFEDLLVGATGNYAFYGLDENARGYVVYGGPGERSDRPLEEIASGADGRGFVAAAANSSTGSLSRVRNAGDVDGDGRADFVTGTRSDVAYVVFGATGGAAVSMGDADFRQSGRGFAIDPGEDSFVGRSVAVVGDTDGDGRSDVLVGTSANTAYLVFGKADSDAVVLSELEATGAGVRISGENDGDGAGFAVSDAGDVNGDGLADFIIGAPTFAPVGTGRSDAGRAYVVYGRADRAAIDLSEVAQNRGGFVVTGPSGAQLGFFVAAVGDLNGDGFADVAFGQPYADDERGAVVVVFGRPVPRSFDEPPPFGSGFILEGEIDGGRAGTVIAGAGDVDGDGFEDLLVAAPLAAPTGPGSSRTYVVLGGDFGPFRAPD